MTNPGGIDELGVTQLGSVVDVDDEGGDSDFFLMKEAHVYGGEGGVFDGFGVGRVEDEVMLESDLDVE